MTEGYKYIFDQAIQAYHDQGSQLESFRHSKHSELYGFLINGSERDEQSLELAKQINCKWYDLFMTRNKKGYTGYLGCEEKYNPIDDLDSKHILILTFLLNKNLDIKNIVEIGGGFGNMIRLLTHIDFEYTNWNIIDLPHINILQEYYLKHEITSLEKITFTDCDSIDLEQYNKKQIDLVIGIHSLSELSLDYFIIYFNHIIQYSKYLYLGYNENCPSPQLIQYKLQYILANGFEKIDSLRYKEKHGASVSYTLFRNTACS